MSNPPHIFRLLYIKYTVLSVQCKALLTSTMISLRNFASCSFFSVSVAFCSERPMLVNMPTRSVAILTLTASTVFWEIGNCTVLEYINCTTITFHCIRCARSDQIRWYHRYKAARCFKGKLRFDYGASAAFYFQFGKILTRFYSQTSLVQVVGSLGLGYILGATLTKRINYTFIDPAIYRFWVKYDFDFALKNGFYEKS